MILAVDIGTSFFKLSLVGIKGEIYHRDRILLKTFSRNGKSEQKTDEWISAWETLFSRIPVSHKKGLEGIVVSGNGPTIVPVLKKGYGNIILWSDSSSLKISGELSNKIGKYIPGNFYLPRLYYLMKYERDYYNSIDFILSGPEFLCYYLTKNKFTVLPGDGFRDLYWSNTDLDVLDIKKSKLPDFLKWGEVYGYYKSIPVICGGPDFIMSILGCGAIKEGTICDRTGTSEGINYNSSSKIFIDNFRTLPHVIPNLHTIAGLIPDSGELANKGDFASLVNKYEKIVNGLLSNNLKIRDIRVIGGHSQIDILNRKKSELFNIPYRIYSPGAEMVGNGVLGYSSLGLYKSIEDACESMVKEQACIN